MFNMGFLEMLAIGVIALVVIGPKQLPHVAKVIGRMMGEFRRATSDFHREIYRAEENFNTEMNQVKDSVQFRVDEPNTKPDMASQKQDTEMEKLAEEDTSHSRHHRADLYPEDSYHAEEHTDHDPYHDYHDGHVSHDEEHFNQANGDEEDLPYELALKQKQREEAAAQEKIEKNKEEDKA